MLTSPLSGFSWPVIILNSVDLPAPFGPMMPTIAPGGTVKLRSSISRRSPKRLGHVLELDHLVAQALARRDEDFVGLVALLVVDRTAVPRSAPGAPCPWCGRPWRSAHPFQFLGDRLLARLFGRLFLLQALVLLLQPVGVVALPRNAAAAVEFEDPLGGVVEEVAVVGDRDHGAGEAGQELLQPFDRFGVEVVGRFVEQQHVGLATAAGGTARRGASRRRTACRSSRPTAAGAARRRRLPAGVRACARRRWRGSPPGAAARRRACRSRRPSSA